MRSFLIAAIAIAAAFFAFGATTASAACGSVAADITVGCNKKVHVEATENTKVIGGKALLQAGGQKEGCMLAMKVRRTNPSDKMYGKPIKTKYFVLAASGVERAKGKWADISTGGRSGIRGYEAYPGACAGSGYVKEDGTKY